MPLALASQEEAQLSQTWPVLQVDGLIYIDVVETHITFLAQLKHQTSQSAVMIKSGISFPVLLIIFLMESLTLTFC